MKTPKIHPLKIHFEIPVSPQFKLPRFVYLFIVGGEKLHLIDSGVVAAMSQITDFLYKINREISEVENIFLTHSHPDHIGAAPLIQQKSECKIFAPKEETNWITNPELQFQQRPVPGFFDLVAGPVKVDQIFEDEEIISVEKNITLQVFSTPGHSAGSTSFFLTEQKVLFSGDAILLPGELPVFENVNQYLHSIEKIKQINPEIIYSSWDAPKSKKEIPVLLEQSKNYILNIQKSVRQVANNFQEVRSIDFCKVVLKTLGQNENLANPLLLTSFLACLKE